MITEDEARRIALLCRQWPEHRLTKYRDWRACCNVAQHYIRLLGLRDGPPLKILDLGGGLGYFAAECRALGHDATSLDLPEELPEAAARALGIKYIPHLIVAGVPLPGSETYDLITAIRLNLTEPDRWTWREYADFADDILGRLSPAGRWFMTPNRGKNVDFVVDAQRWRDILDDRAVVTNPTWTDDVPVSVLIIKRKVNSDVGCQ